MGKIANIAEIFNLLEQKISFCSYSQRKQNGGLKFSMKLYSVKIHGTHPLLGPWGM